VKEAIHLLSQQASTSKSVDEIADTAGFNDRKSFYRVFKKTTGLSPTDFRKNMVR
jgi:YesN/AraC family two-component response regulator